MGKILQYRPAYFSGFDNEAKEFNSVAGLFEIPWVENFYEIKGFHKFSIDDTYLMAEYDNGYMWFVVGIITEADDCLKLLPKFKAKEKHLINDKTMKKKDLRTGMLVKFRDNNVFIIINNYLVKANDWFPLESWNDDLTIVSGGKKDDFDIMACSKVLISGALESKNWVKEAIEENLLWERKEIEPEPIILTLDNVDYSETTLRSMIKKATCDK